MDYHDIPIIINSRDRVISLSKLVTWLLEANYKNIIILDNDSTYPPLLDYYKSVPPDIKIILLHANNGHRSMWYDSGQGNILMQLNIDTCYVYTDPDIIPDKDCPKDVVAYFYDILHRYTIPKVGFGLIIDDLPDHYNQKSHVIEFEAQYWDISKIIAPGLYEVFIDTTFALYAPKSEWGYQAIRTDKPYIARHDPWYDDSANPTPELLYYKTHALPDMSHY